MKIGELAERTGLAPSKIRFYEARRLIAPVQRKANGYRDYLPQSVQLLEIIVTAKAAGFSLDEIRHLLPTAGIEKWNWQKLIATLEHKVDLAGITRCGGAGHRDPPSLWTIVGCGSYSRVGRPAV